VTVFLPARMNLVRSLRKPGASNYMEFTKCTL